MIEMESKNDNIVTFVAFFIKAHGKSVLLNHEFLVTTIPPGAVV